MVIIIKDEKDHSDMKKKLLTEMKKSFCCLETSEIRLNAIYQKYDQPILLVLPNTLFLIRNRRSVEPAKFLKNRIIPQLKISCFCVQILGRLFVMCQNLIAKKTLHTCLIADNNREVAIETSGRN